MKSSKKIYKFTTKVWKWQTTKFVSRTQGDSSWHFITLPKEMYTEIRAKHGKGMISIRTTIGHTTWDNSLFPHTFSSSYILAVRKSVRQKEGIMEGDTIRASFKIL